MIFPARLLLLSREDSWSQALSDDIDRLGLRTISASTPEAACMALGDLAIEAVLVNETCQQAWPDLTARLRAAAAPRHIAIIMMRNDARHTVPAGWDMAFTSEAHPQQIVVSIEHLVRACIAEEEYVTRCETFAADLQDLDTLMKAQPPLSLLSVGQPDPEFLAMSHALKAQGVDVVAALSSYSAFDYLHDKNFDAVLLWGGEQPSEALAIAAGMRRNTRLYHTPVLLRLNRLVELDMGDAFLRGVNDIANPSATVVEIADRLTRLASGHRRQSTIRKTLEAMRHRPEMDEGTGLFGRDLFAAHLARLTKACRARQRGLSICVLRIADTPEITRARSRKALDRAVPQIGSMISRLVRAEDSAGRLSNDVFALAMPATTLAEARSVGERISAVVSCTAFDSGQGKPPFVVEFIVGAAELEPGETAAAALIRAAAAVGHTTREAV
ncbi:diguanylate cyclase [Asticcacaulis sp. EMRT-3]|uniref:GGDEF domain-containing protein n=1 Tax=Asticcacaulis sp. EMRT-3 TaxID=3040349 RepID=UPI0024AF3B4D|nr:diguanylate cyclase [Asticcacaulis sp. EMRT-3]MDI7774487.1 diguanylate cyclase [Asticcacaulis sp. EMRT-3]